MTSDVTHSTEIKNHLIAEVIKSAAFYNDEINEQKVNAEVVQLLSHIEAPEGLRGFFYVGQTLLNLFDVTGSTLQEDLSCSDYLIDALRVDLTTVLSKPAAEDYLNNRSGSNWAKLNSLYYLLFCASGLKGSTEDLLFIASFSHHYINNKSILTDPEIQPAHRNRTEEVCRAIRILQNKQQTTFNVLELREYISKWHAHDIARALQTLKQNKQIDSGVSTYVNKLINFFSNNWPKARHRGPIGPQINKRHGRGRRVTVRPEQVDRKQSIVSPPTHLDEQGVDEQDVEILRTHLSNHIEEEANREAYENNSIGAIFDIDLQKLGSINITRHLRQKNNLITSHRLLLSAGSLVLLKNICESRLAKEDRNETVLALYCMLSTGVSLSRLVQLKMYTDDSTVESGIMVSAGQCYWRFKHRVSAVTPPGKPQYFYRSHVWVITPCSAVLHDYFNTKGFTAGGGLFEQQEQQLRKRIDKLLQRTTEKLKVPYVSIDKIESFLSRFTEATETIDPVVLDFSYQLDLYSTRVSRSYVNLSDAQRLNMLVKLWQDVAAYTQDDTVASFFQPMPITVEGERRVGSRYVPTTEFCRQFVAHLQNNLQVTKPGRTLQLSEIVCYHNAYIRYTAWMLGFGTGYRAVYNPLPTLTLHISDLQLLSISDKDDGHFSHSRVVAVADTLNLQLTHLKSHLIRLAELLDLYQQQWTLC